MNEPNTPTSNLPPFERKFLDSEQRLMAIGAGSAGGKAHGLAFIEEVLTAGFNPDQFKGLPVSVPTMTVIRTGVFDAFLARNRLYDIATSGEPDDRIAHAFQKADFPAEFVGDLRALVAQAHAPLAIRSSGLLEDNLHAPFAGIYATKMIPNNQPGADVRFRKLIEAVKLVYASTFFKAARDYQNATGHRPADEKMAVMIQEVAGLRHNDRFYPEVSGVARSYNFYPIGHARPEHGVVNLALGLGKTIVDGGTSWSYSPAHPNANPPFASMKEWLNQTQIEFWAVNMGRLPAFDPIRETEYLVRSSLLDAETDGALRHICSTYDNHAGKIVMGSGKDGPRVLTFAPLLQLDDIPFNRLLCSLLKLCEEAFGDPVEMEFAATLRPARFSLLQVRPMVVSNEKIDLGEDELLGEDALLASLRVMGNGQLNDLKDVVYVRPENFEARHTPEIARELEALNTRLVASNRPYLLIGFGRWGSSDSWLGIPVNWGQISGAKAIVEATLPAMDKELSQGAHFFHNITSFQVSHFSVHHAGQFQIDWQWLARQRTATETRFVRHLELDAPLQVKVDGRSGRGVVRKPVKST